MARRNAKLPIYLDDRDRRNFLDTLAEISERLDWDVWAHCLMPNHYHLLIRTRQKHLSRGMRDLNGQYAMTFNLRHDRVGHVFQGRFKSVLVEEDGHLPEVLRYIALNPVRAELCTRPEQWAWSSYRSALGLASDDDRFSFRAPLAAFAAEGDQARAKFEAFVLAGLTDSADTLCRVPTIAGGEAFLEGLQGLGLNPSPEVPRRERAFKSIGAYEADSAGRNDAIRAAFESGQHTQAELARYFGLHYTTICRIVRNSSCHDAKKQDLTP